jgi:hypothetical protein
LVMQAAPAPAPAGAALPRDGINALLFVTGANMDQFKAVQGNFAAALAQVGRLSLP